MDGKEIVESVSILCVFIVGIVNIFVTIYHNKKSAFINSITNERLRYTAELRNLISEYCALLNNNPDACNIKRDKLKYQILLSLKPDDKDWDAKIISMIKIIENGLKSKDESRIISGRDDLILISQYLLQLEIEGVKIEAEKGVVNKRRKQEFKSIILSKYNRAKNI
jgi:hypothetical protein